MLPTPQSPQQSLTPAQRAFVEGAEALGATTAQAAKGINELPRLSSGELDELVQTGLVREAAEYRYYVFRARPAPAAPPLVTVSLKVSRTANFTPARFAKTLFFWLLVLLIPVLLIRLTAHH